MNDKITNAKIAANIRLLRLHKNYTLQAVAKELSISSTAYMKYEHGGTEFKVEMVQRLADIFQVPSNLVLFAKEEDLLRYVDGKKNTDAPSD